MVLSCIFNPVDGDSRVVRSTGTHLQTESHIAERLIVIVQFRKNSLNLHIKVFRREMYCEAGNISVRVLFVL